MITFALATIPMIGFVGAAVDYSRANSAKAAMQAAVDSTALMLSKEAQSLDDGAAQDQGRRRSSRRCSPAGSHQPRRDADLHQSGHRQLQADLVATGTVPTTFTKVIGQEQHRISACRSQVVWGIKKLELALALDNTGSMASTNKMTELKKAAKSLLTTLKSAAKKDGDIKVAIIPFSVDVNVNRPTSTPTWIRLVGVGSAAGRLDAGVNVGPGSACPWTHGFQRVPLPGQPDQQELHHRRPSRRAAPTPGYICPTAKGTTLYNGCYNSVATTTTTNNTVCSGKSLLQLQRQKQLHLHRQRQQEGLHADDHNVGPALQARLDCERAQHLDRLRDRPRPGLRRQQHSAVDFDHRRRCSCRTNTPPARHDDAAVTFDWTALNAKIDALNPTGNTNVTIGLAWAFQTLTASTPFNTRRCLRRISTRSSSC